jgi:hypothetical protein
MKRVYIAHALSGDWTGGVAAAKGYAYAAARAGYMPIVPYVLMDGILDDTDPEERALGMKLDIEQLRACDEIWLCGERVSAGMHAEIDVAIDLGLEVRRFVTLDDAPWADAPPPSSSPSPPSS